MTISELENILEPHIDRSWFCGLEIPEGWVDLVHRLHTRLVAINPAYKVMQIKSKFGGLRFYAEMSSHNTSDVVYNAFYDQIRLAEGESMGVCERCGGAGGLVSVGKWLFTLCPEHHAEMDAAKASLLPGER